MKIPRKGPLWFVIVGIPTLFLCFVGCLADMTGLDFIANLCDRWLLALEGKNSK